ncbi:LCP family protein [Candidatus Peregrinibacteria bacterium]|nr:LCP family protein [Candidatus Peregrinibacteria bacterium]
MKNLEEQIKNLQVIFGAVVVCLLIMTVGFSAVTKSNQSKILHKEQQINSLIDEVGELKEQNENLIKVMQNDMGNIKEYVKSMNNSNNQLAGKVNQKDDQLSESQITFQKTQQKLEALIKEKEGIINELADKNTKLRLETSVQPIDENSTSVLLIGINQGLTDSLMVLNINPDNKAITTLSIPRDLSYKGRKINELYNAYGVQKLADAIFSITNIPIKHYAVVDFSIFTEVIDTIGGIDVDVPNDLYDNRYPGKNFSYKVVQFKKGLQHMSGEKALEYARSRKANSDFDRSNRQQLILKAVKDKIIASNLIQDLPTLLKLYATIQQKLETDIAFYDGLSMVQKYQEFEIKAGNVLSTSNYLYSSKNKSGQYILLPNGGSYAGIKKYVASLINE